MRANHLQAACKFKDSWSEGWYRRGCTATMSPLPKGAHDRDARLRYRVSNIIDSDVYVALCLALL